MPNYTPNLRLFKYDVVADAKDVFSITKALNENWDKLDNGGGGGGMELGDIGQCPLGIDESQNLRRYLNGQSIPQDQFKGLTDKLRRAKDVMPNLFVSNNEFDTEVRMSALGQCGKFVIDDNTHTIRLPRIINAQGLFDLHKAGMRIDAGLPNIEGTLSINVTAQNTGAFSYQRASHPSVQGYNVGTNNEATFDASLSNPIYGKSSTVQEEAIQYPYFIQVATGMTEKDSVVNEYQLNNPYTLFDYKYTDAKLFNVSWLLSDGKFHEKSKYVGAYNALAIEYNSKIAIGTITESGYIKRGLSVKAHTEHPTDYDFVINLSNETFRLPNKANQLSVKEGNLTVTGKNIPVKGNGISLGLTNGAKNFGFYGTQSEGFGGRVETYGQNVGYENNGNNAGQVGRVGITTDSSKSGIEADMSKANLAANTDSIVNDHVFLYYYVGETIQNANLINAGRLVDTANTGLAVGAMVSYLVSDNWTPEGYLPTNGGEYSKDGIFEQLWSNFLTKQTKVKKQVRLPHFTANETEKYKVSDSRNNVNAYKIINGELTTKIGAWNTYKLTIELPEASMMKYYSIAANNNDYPTAWKLQASNDNVKWDDIDVITNETFNPKQEKIFVVNNDVNYKYYHILFTAGKVDADNGALNKVNFVLNQASTILDVCTFQEYDNEIAQTGECLRWGVDTQHGLFRVPTKRDEIFTPNQGTLPVRGNGMTLGLTNGTDYAGMSRNGNGTWCYLNLYGKPVGTTTDFGTNMNKTASVGVTQDSSKSGLEADLTNNTKKVRYFVYVANAVVNENAVNWNRIIKELRATAHLIETYVNGTSGYRIWSDGYCEQWGATTAVDVTFLKTYKDNPNVLITVDNPKNGYRVMHYTTTTGFKIVGGAVTSINWRAIGYLAEGEY